MAVIHQTTMVPSKLELLTRWLPKQDWYTGGPDGPSLCKVGGFRLDDPAGEVGIEFLVVRDDAAPELTAYHVPMTYRGSPLAGSGVSAGSGPSGSGPSGSGVSAGDGLSPPAGTALIGTAEHGVLGQRWIYDGTADPVLLAALTELIRGQAQAQAQSQTSTPDATVHVLPAPTTKGQQLGISFTRLLVPLEAVPPAGPTLVTALWTATDGTLIRSALAAARPLVK